MTEKDNRPGGVHDIDAISARVAECETSYDTLRLMREVAKSYDFEFFSILRLPIDDPKNLAQMSIISNWPPDLVRGYDELGILGSSPILQALRTSTKPRKWTLKTIRPLDPEDLRADVAALFANFGMTSGIYFPAQDASGSRGAVSFAGSRGDLTDDEILELAFFSNLVYEKATELRADPYLVRHPLSGRELECLRWTATGKTSAEIAALLGLSEHTVNHYLAGACQKLGAVNRTHAVARAIRANILD